MESEAACTPLDADREPTSVNEHNRLNTVGQKLIKYGSFDSSAMNNKRLRLSKSAYSWQSCPSTGITFNLGAYLSPGSSNTLTGTMYTASEGVRTSVSGMTSISDSIFDGNFLTPVGGSRNSLQEDTTVNKSYNSSSGSFDDFDLEKENALNEEKLKDIVLQKELSKDSLQSKSVNGINGKSKKKGRLKRSKDKHFEEVCRSKSESNKKPVVQGILKKSVSCDSGKFGVRQKNSNAEAKQIVGGTKALLIQKVSDLYNMNYIKRIKLLIRSICNGRQDLVLGPISNTPLPLDSDSATI